MILFLLVLEGSILITFVSFEFSSGMEPETVFIIILAVINFSTSRERALYVHIIQSLFTNKSKPRFVFILFLYEK